MATARTCQDRKGQRAAIIQNRHDNGMIGKQLHVVSLCPCTTFWCLGKSGDFEWSAGKERDINRTGLHITDARGMIDCVALLLFDDAAADYELERNVLLYVTWW